jgi:hypothetical protein
VHRRSVPGQALRRWTRGRRCRLHDSSMRLIRHQIGAALNNHVRPLRMVCEGLAPRPAMHRPRWRRR